MSGSNCCFLTCVQISQEAGALSYQRYFSRAWGKSSGLFSTLDWGMKERLICCGWAEWVLITVPVQGLTCGLKAQGKETRMKYSKEEMWLEEKTTRMQEPILTLILRVSTQKLRSGASFLHLLCQLVWALSKCVTCKEYICCSSEVS